MILTIATTMIIIITTIVAMLLAIIMKRNSNDNMGCREGIAGERYKLKWEQGTVIKNKNCAGTLNIRCKRKQHPGDHRVQEL